MNTRELKHVSSVWWHLIRPFAAVLIAQGLLLSITVFRPGHHAPNFQPAGPSFMLRVVDGIMYGSVMPAPGVSLFDALIYFTAGYYGYQRTRSIRTSILIAGSTSIVGFGALFMAAALITPSLLRAPFADPFILFILSVYLMIPLAYSVLLGALAGLVGRLTEPFTNRALGVS